MRAFRKDIQDAVLLTLRGDFDAFVVPHFVNSIEGLLAEGVRHVVLNLRLVKFVNSTALGALIRVRRKLQRHGGDLLLSQPSAACREAIEALGIEGQFSIHDDDQLALHEVA